VNVSYVIGNNDADDDDDDMGHITGEEQPVLLGCRFVDKDFAPQKGPSGTFSSNGVLAAAAAANDDDDATFAKPHHIHLLQVCCDW